MQDRRRAAGAPADPPASLHQLRHVLTARPWATFAVALVSVVAIGLIDWALGPDVASSVFYLIPVSLVAWSSARWMAFSVAGMASVAWMLADMASGNVYSHPMVTMWNTGSRLLVFAIIAALLAELTAAIERAEHLARIDPLTGTANSRWFRDRAEQMQREGADRAFVVAYVDLDDFKSVNDSRGHSGGDEVLRLVGASMMAAVRGGDLVGRLGGDEFALILTAESPQAAGEAVDAVVDRVRAALQALRPSVTFSLGAVIFDQPPASLDVAIEAADQLMYDVKRGGKNRAVRQRQAATTPAA